MVKGASTEDQQSVPAVPEVRVQEYEVGAASYATMFAREYLAFDVDNPNHYATRLAPFLSPGLDRNAGVAPNTIVRSTVVNGVWPLELEEVANDRYVVTVAASVTAFPPSDHESGDTPEPTTYYTAVAIPVAVVRAEGDIPGARYVVWDLPRPVPMPEKVTLQVPSPPGELVTDPEAEKLLVGFFKAWTSQDNTEGLAWFFADRTPMPSIGSRLAYHRLNNYEMYRQPDGSYLTLAEVELKDRITGAIARHRYTLTLVHADDAWYIRSFGSDLPNPRKENEQ